MKNWGKWDLGMQQNMSTQQFNENNFQYQRHNDTHFIIYNNSDLLTDYYKNNSELTQHEEEVPVEPLVPEFKWVITVHALAITTLEL